jgi:hypothetical protein
MSDDVRGQNRRERPVSLIAPPDSQKNGTNTINPILDYSRAQKRSTLIELSPEARPLLRLSD